MRSLRTFAFAAVFVVPTLAMAEPGGHEGACRTDVRSFCAGVQPGGGRIRDCMREHRAQLSIACKVAIADRMLEHKGHNGPGGQRSTEHQSVVGSTAIKSVPSRN